MDFISYSTISLGKFGSFKANDIIGHAWGNSYEIYDRDNKTRVYHPDDMNEIDETANNNREIVDDGASQKLTSEQIKALKNEGLKGELTGEVRFYRWAWMTLHYPEHILRLRKVNCTDKCLLN